MVMIDVWSDISFTGGSTGYQISPSAAARSSLRSLAPTKDFSWQFGAFPGGGIQGSPRLLQRFIDRANSFQPQSRPALRKMAEDVLARRATTPEEPAEEWAMRLGMEASEIFD
jgi:hypothetical protein